jgi:TRAP-type C4-dicarboxylate transport system substrate-binding protein
MSCDRLDTRRSLLGFLTGVPVALRSCGAIAQQPNLLVLRSYFSPGTRSHNAAQYFAGEATEKANGKFIVPVDAVHSTFRPFKQIAEASSLAHYYAPMGANLEPIFRLSALPMLVASFDEAETLLRIARPYYSATLAHYDQILLAADPWQPGALWSKQPIQSAADIDGSVFGLEEYADVAGWGATVERLGARRVSADANFVVASGYVANLGRYGMVYPNFIEVFIAAQLIFLTVNRRVFESLPNAQRQVLVDAGRDMEAAQWKSCRELLEQDHRDMTEQGVSVITHPPQELVAALRSAAQPDIQSWVQSMGSDGAEILNSYWRAIGRR